jgi:type IV secretion system protein VirD4
LGTVGGRLIAAEHGQFREDHRSGHPRDPEWDGPIIATSVKTDLVRDTLAWREIRGDAWIYDPTASTGLPAATWSPLAACDTWQGA